MHRTGSRLRRLLPAGDRRRWAQALLKRISETLA
jgi:hypothetical protein